MALLLLARALLLVAICHQGQGTLRLNSYFGNHMVLQAGHQQAVLWGTAVIEGDVVTAYVTGAGADVTPVTTTVSGGRWKVKLPVQPYSPKATSCIVHVSSSEGRLTLTDVLFGDVWLCSGQSNMYFTLDRVINSTAELAHAHLYPQVRFTRAMTTQSPTPLDNMDIGILWTGPNSMLLGKSSAVCWLYGQYLFDKLQRPMGLIESSYGGTPIEAWSPPEALQACATSTARRTKRGPTESSVLWNAMIHPILSTTIYGAIWYQGESNSGRYQQYGCQMQAMVDQWRDQFHQNSLQQTSSHFPFGYVQLAGNVHRDVVGGFPGLRWAQTANYGYSPNPALPNTFMAVAMDLPDYSSPFGTIHPRFKQDVAERLVKGALSVAYGQSQVQHQGPFPSQISAQAGQPHSLSVLYSVSPGSSLEKRNDNGFEVCCSKQTSATSCDVLHDYWQPAPIVFLGDSGVVRLNTSLCFSHPVVGLRYEWRTSPCDYKRCALYDAQTGLPAPPYITLHLATSQGPEPIG